MAELAHVSLDQVETFAVARISGEVDASNVDTVTMQLDGAFDGARGFVLDLSETTYLDLAGVRLVFALAERAAARGQVMKIVAPRTAPLRRLLDFTGVSSQYALYESVTDACSR